MLQKCRFCITAHAHTCTLWQPACIMLSTLLCTPAYTNACVRVAKLNYHGVRARPRRVPPPPCITIIDRQNVGPEATVRISPTEVTPFAGATSIFLPHATFLRASVLSGEVLILPREKDAQEYDSNPPRIEPMFYLSLNRHALSLGNTTTPTTVSSIIQKKQEQEQPLHQYHHNNNKQKQAKKQSKNNQIKIKPKIKDRCRQTVPVPPVSSSRTHC